MVDGIGSMSRNKFGIATLEGTNSNYSELNWKTVTKGKRSRKSVTRSGHCKQASESPKRGGEFSGSETDGFLEPLLGPHLADGLGCVPIKKRRHLLHSSMPSGNLEQLSPQQQTLSSHSEDSEHLSDNKGISGDQSSDSYSTVQGLACGVNNNSGKGGEADKVSEDGDNLSGIELLAAAACCNSMDDKPDAVKVEVKKLSSSPRECDDICTLPMPLGESISCSESGYVHQKGTLQRGHEKSLSFAEDFSIHIFDENKQGEASRSISSNVDRRHWDLNTLMETWEESQQNLVARNNSVAEASIDVIQKVKLDVEEECPTQLDSINCGNNVNHVLLGLVGVATTIFESKVVSPREVSPCQVEDSDNVGSTLLGNCEREIALLEDTRSVMPRSENNSHMKDAEDSLKTNELSENRSVLLEEILGGKTCKNVEKSECTSEDLCHSLRECENVSTFDVSVVGQSAVFLDGKGHDGKVFVTDDALETDDSMDHDSKDLISQNDSHLVSKAEVGSTSILQASVKTLIDDDYHESDISEDGDQGPSDAMQNISELQADYDSPYEDGELRGPALYSWDRNEVDDGENECVDYESDGRVGEESDAGDYPGSEIVEAGSEGSQATEKKHSSPAQVSETVTRKSSLGFNKGTEQNMAKIKTEGKKESNQGSGTTDELCIPAVHKDDVSVRRKHSFDRTDRVDTRGSCGGEVGSKMTREKLHLCVEGSSKEAVYYSQSRSCKVGDSPLRTQRSSGADRSVTSYRSTSYEHQQIGGYSRWNYRDSGCRYQFRGPEDRRLTSENKFDDVNYYENNKPVNFSSKGIQRSCLRRRSPFERDDYYGDHRGVANISGYRRGSSGNFTEGSGRGYREEFEEPVFDDPASSGHFPRYLSRLEHRFSSPPSRVPDESASGRKSRSRSRTRSPRVWDSQQERNLISRRHSRSPDFRSGSTIERMRVPFQGGSFISPPEGGFLPTNNNRWVNERDFANPLRHRRSPVGVFRRSQRLDPVGLPGRLKADDYFRPNARSGRLKGVRLDENSDDRKHDERLRMVHRSLRDSDTRAIWRRSRHDAHVNLEDDNNNNEDDRDSDRKNSPSFATEYGESFLSPPRGRISTCSNRWGYERNFDGRLSRHRRSSPTVFGRTQRWKPDDHLKPVNRSGRFNAMPGFDWRNDLVEKCDDRRHEEKSGMIRRAAPMRN